MLLSEFRFLQKTKNWQRFGYEILSTLTRSKSGNLSFLAIVVVAKQNET